MANVPTLSIHITTTSRPTLARMLTSLRRWNELADGDEVLLIGDGPNPAAEQLWERAALPGRYIEYPGGPHGFWGHEVRNSTMHLAAADYLMAADDDDEYVPGALTLVRRALMERPGHPHLFRMDGVFEIGTVWTEPEIREGNVGTPMLVTPVEGHRWAKYGMHRTGDHDFIRDTVAMWPPGALVWREEVIYKVRPWQK